MENKGFDFNYQAKNTIRLLCAAAIIVMLAVSIVVYGAPAGTLAFLFAFFVLYVQLPGMQIVRWLGFGTDHLSTQLAMGAVMGWALNIGLFYVTGAMHIQALLYVIGPALSCFCFVRMAREGKAVKKGGADIIAAIPSSFFIYAALTLLFCLIGTQYQYVTPPKGAFAFISGDRAYHAGLVNTISHGFPLESLWIKGIPLRYHIFTDMLLAVPVRLFDIRSDVIIESFAPLLTVFFVGISLYSFFREMSAKPERAGLYCLIFFLSSMYITRRPSSSLAFKFIYTNDNCAGFGVAASLMFILVFGRWYRDFEKRERGRYRSFAMCLALMALITGIKGPVAAVLVAGLWGTAVLGIVLRKMPLRTLLPVMLLTAGFVTVYISVLGASGQINGPGGAALGFGEIANIAFWKDSLVDLLKSFGVPTPVRLVITMIVFTAFFFTAYLVPFCLGYARELWLVITQKKEYDPARVLVYASALAGFLAMLMLHYTGHNQVYFGLVTVILAPVISYWFLEDMEKERSSSKRADRILRCTAAVMAVTLVFTSLSLAAYCVRRGSEAAGYGAQTTPLSQYCSVSRDEFEAMMWIRENTARDAVLATDRYYSVSPDKYEIGNRWQNTFFLYEVYANRYSYISGSGYDLDNLGSQIRKDRVAENVKLYDPAFEGRGDLARKLGVDYVILSKRFTGDPDLSNEDYELCFSNKDVNVYKIVGQ